MYVSRKMVTQCLGAGQRCLALEVPSMSGKDQDCPLLKTRPIETYV